jgi:hypothetical protein
MNMKLGESQRPSGCSCVATAVVNNLWNVQRLHTWNNKYIPITQDSGNINYTVQHLARQYFLQLLSTWHTIRKSSHGEHVDSIAAPDLE